MMHTFSTLCGEAPKRMDHYKSSAFNPTCIFLAAMPLVDFTVTIRTHDRRIDVMHRLAFLAVCLAATPAVAAPSALSGGSILALFIFMVVAWISFRVVARALRARKTEAAVGGSFEDYVLEALANAAHIDGRLNPAERTAIAGAMREIAGPSFDEARVEAALGRARLSKAELVAYLASHAGSFTHEQKSTLLKALLAVFVSDGAFDEIEHAALVDYTAAVGFDRQSAPQTLRQIASDFSRGNIT
jgi:tellurite resistance protein